MVVKYKGNGKPATLLSGEQRIYVVRALAHWNSPSEVARMLLAEYGITVTRQCVQTYDPTSAAGASLSTELRKYFYDQRKRFVNGVQRQPLAQRSVRLEQLKKIYDEARDAGNAKLAIKALSEAGKEMKPLNRVGGDDEERDE
jgi:hypothetical protein